MFLLTGTAFIDKDNLFILSNTLTLIVMTFKKYSIKSHYKVNLVRHCDASSLCFNLWGNFLKF